MKNIIFIVIITVLSVGTIFGAGPATLRWTDPTTWTDGSPLPASAIVKHTVYWGTASRVYPNKMDVGKVTSHTLTSLATGTHYFAVTVTALDGTTQSESDYSNEAVKFIPASKPGGCVLTVE